MRLKSMLFPVLLVGAGLLVYANSFTGEFILDDYPEILDSPRVRSFPPLRAVLSDPARTLVYTSLQVNYALGGLQTWGYHVFNLAIHLLAGLTLFGLLRRTLRREPAESPVHRAADVLAFAVALLWLVHPLQTQAVTYVIQRAEALMGFFYLLTLYCLVAGDEAATRTRRWLWYAGLVVSCGLGMLSKEVMVTAPVIVLLYDRIFLAPSWRALLQRRWPLYLGAAASLLLLATALQIILNPGAARASVGLGVRGVTPWQYLSTQPGVLLHYLRLVFWPYPLCLDYMWPTATSIPAIVGPGLVVVALLLLTAWALWRHPRLGFWGAWFFLILAPTSSIMPLADSAVEHRLYLPLVGVLVLVVRGAFAALRAYSAAPRLAFGALIACTVVLGALTLLRNAQYQSEIAMWQDVLRQAPHNHRAHHGLARALKAQGKFDQAVPHFVRALELEPNLPHYRLSYAILMIDQGRAAEAEPHLRAALAMDPANANAYNALGIVRAQQGQLAEAEAFWREGLKQDASVAHLHSNLAGVLARRGQYAEAEACLREAARLEPGFAQIQVNWGLVLLRLGRIDDAVPRFGRATELYPRDPVAWANLGYALQRCGHSEQATQAYRRALALAPNWPLENAQQAWPLATHPDAARRDGAEALRLAEQANEATGGQNPTLLDVLAAAHAEVGHYAAAASLAEQVVAGLRAGGQTEHVAEIERRLQLYRAGQPLRDERLAHQSGKNPK